MGRSRPTTNEPQKIVAYELDGKLYRTAHAARKERVMELCVRTFGEDYGPGFMNKLVVNDMLMEAVVSFYHSKKVQDVAAEKKGQGDDR
jgi:hypothetical protein